MEEAEYYLKKAEYSRCMIDELTGSLQEAEEVMEKQMEEIQSLKEMLDSKNSEISEL